MIPFWWGCAALHAELSRSEGALGGRAVVVGAAGWCRESASRSEGSSGISVCYRVTDKRRVRALAVNREGARCERRDRTRKGAAGMEYC